MDWMGQLAEVLDKAANFMVDNFRAFRKSLPENSRTWAGLLNVLDSCSPSIRFA